MITLSKSGSTVIFDFDNNSGYLQNGTIEVPVNSLSLIIDSSDMITFKKSASNDIFVSALASDFGMTKSELEAWYKENMVGETGGGTDTGTVQTMIDESISGKADSSTVNQELANKLDVSAYTPVVVESAITENSTNTVESQAIYDKTTVTTEIATTLLTFGNDGKTTNYPSGCTKVSINIYPPSDYETNLFINWNETFWGEINMNNGAVSFSVNTQLGTDFNATTAYSDNVFTIEINSVSSGTTDDLTVFMIPPFSDPNVYGDAYAIDERQTTYWLKDYVKLLEARIEALEQQNNS